MEISNPENNTPIEPYVAAAKRGRWSRILHWQYSGLSLIVIITLVLHFVAITKPPTIVWDEVWYVGTARQIISGNPDVRPEHPPLAKLFVVAGEYIFNGFKAPIKDTEAMNIEPIGSSSETDNVIKVGDARVFSAGTTIIIGAEQMDVQTVDTELNLITVKRGAGGTTVTSHDAEQPIRVFTDSAFGWRFFSIIFGTIAIVLFFFICRKLGMSHKATLIATFLFAFDDMSFIHAGLALLDVFMVTLMLAGFLLYLHKGYLLSGMSMALAALCKLSGALGFVAILVHWILFRRDSPKRFAASVVVTGVSFLSFLQFFDIFAMGKLENPIQRTLSMLELSAVNVFTDPPLSISSRPWEWLFPWKLIVYSYDPQYISFISWTIQIFIIPVFVYLIYRAIKGNDASRVATLWFICSYIVWIPINLLTNRVSFVFYFYPTIPAVCIGIGLALSAIIDRFRSKTVELGRVPVAAKVNYAGIGFYLGLHFAIFLIFNPAFPLLFKLWLPPFNVS